MSWKRVNFNQLIPTEISASVSASVGLVEQYMALTQATVEATSALRLRLGVNADPIGVALKALVATLEGFLQLGKAHVLFVPLAKIFPGESALGGNARFYNVFARALQDDFDLNRPQYANEGDAVAMSVVMMGAPSYVRAIEGAAAFGRIFRPPPDADLAANTIPTPQNLRAKPAAHPAAGRVAIQLSWDVPKAAYTFPYFPGIGTKVKRYAVIRSTSMDLLKARSVLDLFGTRALTVGLTSQDTAKHHKVLAVGTGANSSYLDKDTALDETQTYYYAVCWELSVTEKGTATVIKFDRVSNVVKTRVRAPAATANATPPNWDALPSLIQLVPALADSIFLFVQQLKAFSNRSNGPSAGVRKAVGLAESRLARLADEMDALNTSFKSLKVTLQQPVPTVHATTFYGVGGNDFLQAQLYAALNAQTDPNRPPFDDNEYVMGMCIVAGGPRLADIQPVIDFLGMLFGGADAPNALLGILETLEGAVSDAEVLVFGANMQPLPVNPDGTVQTPDRDVDPADIDPNTGIPTVETHPVVGTDGTPLDTDDPDNPQAGETNVTPLSELC